jgi:biopolymer transport protein ExbD
MSMHTPGRGTNPNINVTPLVDVVLVLLIIFMVVTPLLEKEMPVRVPELETEPTPPQDIPPDQLVVQIRNGGRVYINLAETPKEQLLDKLTAANASRAEKVVFFDAEDTANYGTAVEVLDIIKQAGTDTIGMMLPDPDAPVAAAGTAPAAPPK